jgi:hypothetical protein
MSIADELAKLEELRARGVLTQEEFDEQKASLLAGQPQLRPQMFTPPSSTELPPPMPATHLAEAILATVLCCLPFGIVAIIKAANVSGAYHAGRYDEALESSAAAQKWAMWSMITGLIGGLAYGAAIMGGVLRP